MRESIENIRYQQGLSWRRRSQPIDDEVLYINREVVDRVLPVSERFGLRVCLEPLFSSRPLANRLLYLDVFDPAGRILLVPARFLARVPTPSFAGLRVVCPQTL